MKRGSLVLMKIGLFFLIFFIIGGNNVSAHNESIINGNNSKYIFNSTYTRLVDIIMLSDSNQLFGGGGWDHGWQQAGLNTFGNNSMYGSGIISFYESNGGGTGVGYSISSGANTIKYRSGGATGRLPLQEIHCGYWCWELWTGNAVQEQYVQYPNSTANASIAGITIGSTNPLGMGVNVSDMLLYRLSFGYFNGTLANSSNPQFSIFVINGSTTWTSKTQTTRAQNTSYNYTYFTLLLPNDTRRTSPATLDWRRQSPSAASNDSYPYVNYFQNIVRVNKTTGFQASTLFAMGGTTIVNVSNFTQTMNKTRISNFIRFVTDHQVDKGLAPMTIVILNFGVNDVSRSVTENQYLTNANTTIQIIRDGWIDLGYNTSNLQFILMPSHPTQLNDSNLAPYRNASATLARLYSYVTFANLSAVTNYTELNDLTNTTWPRYVGTGGVDTSHLNESNDYSGSSYAILATRLLDDILAYTEAVNDTTAPSITVYSPNTSVEYTSSDFPLLLNVTLGEEISGGSSTVVYWIDSSTVNYTLSNTTNVTWNASISLLGTGTYNLTVWAQDASNNSNSTSQTLRVVATAVDSESSSSSRNPSLGYWISSYDSGSADLSSGQKISRSLYTRERLKLKIEGEEHFIGLISVGNGKAVINISSTPQQVVMSMGEQKKINLDGDDDLDLLITLNSIERNRVSLILEVINESVRQTPSQDSSQHLPMKKETNNAKSMAFILVGICFLILLVGYVLENYRRKNRFKHS